MRLLIAAVLGSALTLGAQTPPAINVPAGNVETGKRLYTSVGCFQCHGYEAQGGGGSRLAPNPLGFAAFSKYVRVPIGQMPPYTTKVLSNQQLADIYAFLRTIPAAPSVESLPLLNGR